MLAGAGVYSRGDTITRLKDFSFISLSKLILEFRPLRLVADLVHATYTRQRPKPQPSVLPGPFHIV